MDSTLLKIQLDFVSGERTSFSQFFDMLQCIFDVKIGLELPFGANDHREGEHQMDILLATVQTRHQLAAQGTALISYVRGLCAKRCLFMETSYRFKSAVLNMSKALWSLTQNISQERGPELMKAQATNFCRSMPSIYVDRDILLTLP